MKNSFIQYLRSSVTKFLLSHLVSIALVLGAAYLFVRPWLKPSVFQTLRPIVQVPYDLRNDLFHPDQVDTTYATIPVYHLTERQRKKVEKKIGGEVPPNEGIIAVGKIDPAPNGGTVLVYLPRLEVPGSTPAKVRFYPAKQKFFELMSDREVSLGWGAGASGLQRNLWLLEYRQEVARIGPAVVGLRGGLFALPPDLSTSPYIMINVSVKF